MGNQTAVFGPHTEWCRVEYSAAWAGLMREHFAVPQNVFVGPVARFYDASSAAMSETSVVASTVELLAGLARGGRALEFAIGTGRIGLPLQQRGIEVHGIEISEDMVAELRNKTGGESLPVTIGDMATTRVDGEFQLVYLVYNTISNLLTQFEQVACFRNAAAHLVTGGSFVIELEVPQLRRIPPGEFAYAFDVSDEHLGFGTYDFVNQREVSHHYWPTSNGLQTFQSHHRYAWPSELDLMADMAGMRFRERWADWNRTPFTNDSRAHVSVWDKEADGAASAS